MKLQMLFPLQLLTLHSYQIHDVHAEFMETHPPTSSTTYKTFSSDALLDASNWRKYWPKA